MYAGTEHTQRQIPRRQDRSSQAAIVRLVCGMERRLLLRGWIDRGREIHHQIFTPEGSAKAPMTPSQFVLSWSHTAVREWDRSRGMPMRWVLIWCLSLPGQRRSAICWPRRPFNVSPVSAPRRCAPLFSRLSPGRSLHFVHTAPYKARCSSKKGYFSPRFCMICQNKYKTALFAWQKDTKNRESNSGLSLSVPLIFPEMRYDMTVETNDDTVPLPFPAGQPVSKIKC
jgi:hypothetical protein